MATGIPGSKSNQVFQIPWTLQTLYQHYINRSIELTLADDPDL